MERKIKENLRDELLKVLPQLLKDELFKEPYILGLVSLFSLEPLVLISPIFDSKKKILEKITKYIKYTNKEHHVPEDSKFSVSYNYISDYSKENISIMKGNINLYEGFKNNNHYNQFKLYKKYLESSKPLTASGDRDYKPFSFIISLNSEDEINNLVPALRGIINLKINISPWDNEIFSQYAYENIKKRLILENKKKIDNLKSTDKINIIKCNVSEIQLSDIIDKIIKNIIYKRIEDLVSLKLEKKKQKERIYYDLAYSQEKLERLFNILKTIAFMDGRDYINILDLLFILYFDFFNNNVNTIETAIREIYAGPFNQISREINNFVDLIKEIEANPTKIKRYLPKITTIDKKEYYHFSLHEELSEEEALIGIEREIINYGPDFENENYITGAPELFIPMNVWDTLSKGEEYKIDNNCILLNDFDPIEFNAIRKYVTNFKNKDFTIIKLNDDMLLLKERRDLINHYNKIYQDDLEPETYSAFIIEKYNIITKVSQDNVKDVLTELYDEYKDKYSIIKQKIKELTKFINKIKELLDFSEKNKPFYMIQGTKFYEWGVYLKQEINYDLDSLMEHEERLDNSINILKTLIEG